MDVLDFSRSFVTFVTKGRANNARIQVECRCRVSMPGAGPTEFLLVASCKAEDTFADEHLFRIPNYDFCGIFSTGDHQIIRTHATADQGGKETGSTAERFEDLLIHCPTAERVQQCRTGVEIVQATLANQPLVGVTELRDERSGRSATIDYPIKTMNANDQHNVFQVDTGPVLFPDLELPSARAIEWFELAYVAWNRVDRAEFILQQPTQASSDEPGGLLVPHYSLIRETEAANAIVALAP